MATPGPRDPRDHPDPVERQVSADFADYDRWLRRAGSLAGAFAVAAPLWLLLLLVLPRLGLGAIGGLVGASGVAGGLAIWGERRWRRRVAAGAGAPDGAARRGRPATVPFGRGARWAAVALGVLIVLYLVLVARAGG
jgi:hypothetical protein